MLLRHLDDSLGMENGPHILTDVQYGSGPVYSRYGAFSRIPFVTSEGAQELGIRAPDGSIYLDDRSPSFTLPPWVEVPSSISTLVSNRLETKTRAAKGISVGEYRVQRVLHYSNAGGVYLAAPKDGENNSDTVVLKEARPWTAFDEGGHSAADRLLREIDALNRYQGKSWCVKMLDHFVEHGFTYLVLGRVEGQPLRQWIVDNHPLTSQNGGAIAREHYPRAAFNIYKILADAVAHLHEDGHAFGDLSISNILITPNGRPVLIDFESCVPLLDRHGSAPFTPGYSPARTVPPGDRDKFSLMAILSMMLSPKSLGNLDLDRTFLKVTERDIHELFGAEALKVFRAHIARLGIRSIVEPSMFELEPFPHEMGLSEISTRIAVGLVENPCRSDFLKWGHSGSAAYGSDPQSSASRQKETAYNIERGTAGVIMAKYRSSIPTEGDIAFLMRRRQEIASMPFHGLLEGLVGLAAVVAESTRDVETMERVCGRDLRSRVFDFPEVDSVRSGAAGTLIAALWVNDVFPGYFETETLVAELSARVDGVGVNLEPGDSEVRSTVGIFDGAVGVGAALQLAAFFGVGDSGIYRAQAIRMAEIEIEDMYSEVQDELLVLKVRHGSTVYPYLSDGAAGVALGLRLIDRDYFQDHILAITRGINAEFSFNLGLFRGLLGLHASLVTIGLDASLADSYKAVALRHLRHSGFIHRRAGVGLTLGDGGFRLSENYATGSSGILLGLRALSGDTSCWLPMPKRFVTGRR